MKNYASLLLLMTAILYSIQIYPQGVAINDDNSSPDNSAMLDIKSTEKACLSHE